MQYMPSLRRHVHHACVHPSILAQVVLVGPEAPQGARWPVLVVHEALVPYSVCHGGQDNQYAVAYTLAEAGRLLIQITLCVYMYALI
jgi:hypothetical protein